MIAITSLKKRLKNFDPQLRLILLSFFILGLMGILNHAMWRDEVETWLIVRDSESLADIIGAVNYHGHPLLWALLLAVLKNIINDPVMMKLLHLCIGVISAGIFLFYSPFSKVQKVLFIFGYLPFYQYLLISRNYSLGMLFLFVFCTVFKTRNYSYILLAIALSLMANSNAYALFIAFALTITLIAEFIFDRDFRSNYLKQSQSYDLLFSLGILIVGFLLSIYIIAPPIDSTNHGGVDAWFLEFDLKRLLQALGRLFAGYTLIVPHGARWLDLSICGALTIIIFLVNLISFVKKPFAFLFYGLGTFEIIAFTYFRFMGGGPRHYGHFLLILIAAIWLTFQYPPKEKLINIFRNLIHLSRTSLQTICNRQQVILMMILWVQFFAGILYAYPRDLIIPFSAGRETAQYLRKMQLDQEFIVGSRDTNISPIAAYLNRKIYYPEVKRMGSFTLFKADRKELQHDEILEQIESELLQDRKKVLLILHKKLDEESRTLTNELEIDDIMQFENSWTDTERYYLYWVRRQAHNG